LRDREGRVLIEKRIRYGVVKLALPVARPLNIIPALPGPTVRVDAIFP
jgi:hypothetical protein